MLARNVLDRDLRELIEEELSLYPVQYMWDMRKNGCATLEIDGNGQKDRIAVSRQLSGRSNAALALRGQIRRAIRAMGVEPHPSRKHKAMSPLGDKLLEAALAMEPEPTPQSQKEEIVEAKRNIIAMPTDLPVAANKEPEPKEARSVKLLQSEVTQVTRLLLLNAVIDDAAKSVVYNDGWSDKRIAELIAKTPGREGISEKHIVALRRDNFGLLPAEIELRRKFGPAPSERDLLARIEALEASNRDLAGRLEKVEEAVTRP